MSFSPDDLSGTLARDAGTAWCVAFSGGLDSMVLLHALASLRDSAGATLRALHINHHMHADADAWAAHCVAAAAGLGVHCTVLDVEVRAHDPEGPEAAARRARQRAFAAALGDGETLLTAQHLDDQAETVLLALLRGSGPDGIASMPAVAACGHGRMLRPLLEYTRSELQEWAGGHGFEWIDDPANADQRLARGWLRARVMPELTARSPGHPRSLARSAKLAAEASALLDELATADLGGCAGGPLPLTVLQGMTPARGRNLLRGWLRSLGLPTPSYPRLLEAHRQVLEAGPDRQPEIAWPGAVLRRHRGHLHAHAPLPPPPGDWRVDWDGGGRLELPPGLGSLRLVEAPGGLSAAKLRGNRIGVRFRAGGEQMKTAGATHHSKLKQLLQRAGVPPWLRGRMPLLEVAGEPVAVADLWIAAEWVATDDEPALKVEWERPGG